MEIGYEEAYAEVIDIINHMDNTLLNKIPQKVIQFLNTHAAKDYVINLDYSKSINEMSLNTKTSAILTIIFLNYLCDLEKKQNYLNKLEENERLYQEELVSKYSYENILKKNKNVKFENEKSLENTALSEYTKPSILAKLINKIKSIFKIK